MKLLLVLGAIGVFQGGEGGKEKTRPKNSNFKPPTTLSVQCMKIQRGGEGTVPRF